MSAFGRIKTYYSRKEQNNKGACRRNRTTDPGSPAAAANGDIDSAIAMDPGTNSPRAYAGILG